MARGRSCATETSNQICPGRGRTKRLEFTMFSYVSRDADSKSMRLVSNPCVLKNRRATSLSVTPGQPSFVAPPLNTSSARGYCRASATNSVILSAFEFNDARSFELAFISRAPPRTMIPSTVWGSLGGSEYRLSNGPAVQTEVGPINTKNTMTSAAVAMIRPNRAVDLNHVSHTPKAIAASKTKLGVSKGPNVLERKKTRAFVG